MAKVSPEPFIPKNRGDADCIWAVGRRVSGLSLKLTPVGAAWVSLVAYSALCRKDTESRQLCFGKNREGCHQVTKKTIQDFHENSMRKNVLSEHIKYLVFLFSLYF